jgi:branched-chain amino acid transport system substrate-binding protein
MRYSPLIGLFCVGLFLDGAADAQTPSGVVRIGILNDQSGPYADFGGKTSVDAARMAVEDVGGKVLGKSIEIIIGDHQNKPDVGSAIARRWFDVDGVSAVAELTNSAVALAVQQIAKEKGKITLFTGPATTRLTNEDCSPTGFHWAFDTYSQAVGTARAVIAEGGKSVREDGRMMHDMYLVEVKTPSESKAKWDYYKVLRRIPAEEAAQPLNESKCSLVKK